MGEGMIDLILSGMGIGPGDPRYGAARSAVEAQAGAASSAQGRQFNEERRQFDRRIQQEQRALDNQYKIAKLSARNQQEANAIDRWRSEKQYEIDTKKLALDTELGRGQLALDTELGRGRLDVDRGAQGLDLLRTSVELGNSPRNWGAAFDWRRGVQANTMAPQFLRALLQNAGASAGSAAPSTVTPRGMPERNTLAAVLGDLGMAPAAAPAGGTSQPAAKEDPNPAKVGLDAIAKAYVPSSSAGYDQKDEAFLSAIATLAGMGTQKSANRTAMLDDDEQQGLAGGLDRLGIGGDWWLRQSERQRVGQQGSGVAA
jgi:hypothetical protein